MTAAVRTREVRPLRMSAATKEERAVVALLLRLPEAGPDPRLLERIWRRLDAPTAPLRQRWNWGIAAVSAAMALVLTLTAGALAIRFARSQSNAQVLAT